MMGWKYLPKFDNRIRLWRNTIQLFHQYNRPKFIGPFKALNYDYRIEPLLQSKDGKEFNPDVLASGESGWFILELTTNQKSKKPKLNLYRAIDPRDLAQYGLTAHEKEPDIISGRLSFIDDGPFCQIIVNNALELRKDGRLNNKKLQNQLIKAKGMDLTKLPEIPITLLPEMKSQEIRRGLIDIIMQLFDPSCKGKTLNSIVEDGLERIYPKVRVAERRRLLDKVRNEMETLISGPLKGYIKLNDEGKYMATEKFKDHHKTKEFIAFKLHEWAGLGPISYPTIYQFQEA